MNDDNLDWWKDFDSNKLNEFFAGVEGFLSAVAATDNSCPDTEDCYTHYRNTVRAEVESDDMVTAFRCTYDGEYAVVTYVALDMTGYAVTRTDFFKVGTEAIGDKRPSLSTEKPGTDVDKIHDEYLKTLKPGKEL